MMATMATRTVSSSGGSVGPHVLLTHQTPSAAAPPPPSPRLQALSVLTVLSSSTITTNATTATTTWSAAPVTTISMTTHSTPLMNPSSTTAPPLKTTTTTQTSTPRTISRKATPNAANAGAPGDGGVVVATLPTPKANHSRSRYPAPAAGAAHHHLFQGSHIHYSPVDHKPLCSYSAKLCKQRRINGYAFCIRHILEDPMAPFRQCQHVAKYNRQKCSNAIPANEERLFCNSHMQIAGMAPKKERRDAKCKPPSASTASAATGAGGSDQQKCGANQASSSDSAVTDSTAAPVPPNETSNSSHKSSAKSSTINGLPKSAANSGSVDNKCNVVAKRPKRKKKDNKKSIDKFVFARRKRFGDNLFNYHIWSESDDELDDDDTGVGATDCANRRLRSGADGDADPIFPNIFATFATNIEDLEANELKTELIAEKVLLKKLIDVRRRDFAPQLDTTRAILKTLNTTGPASAGPASTAAPKGRTYLDYKLAERSRRTDGCLRKGVCCYTSYDDDRGVRCRLPSLPFARHCAQHILYNVDQLLYSRCTAKCSDTLTQCSHSTFDIVNEEPLCSYHQMVNREAAAADERAGSPANNESKTGKRRRNAKPMAMTRPTRRSKKRMKGTTGATAADAIENSIDSRLSVDDDSQSVDTTDFATNLLAQKEAVVERPDIKHVMIGAMGVPALPPMALPHHQTTTATTTVSASITRVTAPALIAHTQPPPPPEMQFSRLPPLLPPSVVNGMGPVPLRVPLSPVVVSMDPSMPPPPPLEPTEDALVTSIVADLPQLTSDADFTDVLNKIPDEAFSEFLLDHQNGDIPSTEETEALEQALAMVNKDVQNLVAFAGLNGTTGAAASVGGFGGMNRVMGGAGGAGGGAGGASGVQLSDFGGQSDIIGFTNWLSSLTSEQRQQLNGLIDGAIASNSLSPILKNACEAYPQSLPAPPPPPHSSAPMVTNNVPHIPNSFPVIYPLNPLTLGPTPHQQHQHQEFVGHATPVPLMNSNLLMNGLSSHPS